VGGEREQEVKRICFCYRSERLLDLGLILTKAAQIIARDNTEPWSPCRRDIVLMRLLKRLEAIPDSVKVLSR
jgi:hypothetical protein